MSYKYIASGYSNEKQSAINRIISPEDWAHHLPFVCEQGYWLSHAGVGQENPRRNLPNSQKLRVQIEKCIQQAHRNVLRKQLFSLLWHRWSDFVPIRHVNQIVGHTPSSEIRRKILLGDQQEEKKKTYTFSQIENGYGNSGSWVGSVRGDISTYIASDNWCLDTHNKHIGILQDGNLTVIDNPMPVPEARTPKLPTPFYHSYLAYLDLIDPR